MAIFRLLSLYEQPLIDTLESELTVYIRSSKSIFSIPIMSGMSGNIPAPVLEVSRQGIALSVVSLIALLLCFPPLGWHCRNKNFPAACLIFWFIVQNFYNFVNPFIWPTDDVASWWMGYGYCDIQAKFISGSGVGIAGPLVCIFRSLAKVLDTDHTSLVPSKGERRRTLIFEVTFCVLIPIIIMALQFIVQENRYEIFAIIGCMPSYHQSWVSLVVGYIWPPLVLGIAAVYCAIVLFRLVKYKREFANIVSMNSTTKKSRFVRLLTLSLVMFFGSFPVQIYVFYLNVTSFQPWGPFSWSKVHGPDWQKIIPHPMYGQVFYDRWIQATAGFLLFIFFGFGTDATLMYRSVLLKLGFGYCFPWLDHPHLSDGRQGSSSTRFGSISSRARLAFGRKKTSSSTENSSIGPDRSLSVGTSTYLDPWVDFTDSLEKALPPPPPMRMQMSQDSLPPKSYSPTRALGASNVGHGPRRLSDDSILFDIRSDSTATLSNSGQRGKDDSIV
ncbi:a-factor receptor [Myotisia sp. PD_48]|nr:a-factor receptor [Myotisia sp. PD_48]